MTTKGNHTIVIVSKAKDLGRYAYGKQVEILFHHYEHNVEGCGVRRILLKFLAGLIIIYFRFKIPSEVP